jgi:hypothetical protein
LVFDELITHVDLAMSLALIVISNASAPPREHRSDGQQPRDVPGFEDSALRIHEGNALAVELEPAREIGGIEHPAS